MSILFASTFISHSWKQKPLAFELARELTRRGVLAWIDANELPAGVILDTELAKAADAQLTMTALLSFDSITSDWCKREVEPRVREPKNGEADTIIPVYLGDPYKLVQASDPLKTHWLTPDGSAVSKLGIHVPDPATADHASIAKRIAKVHYDRLKIRESAQVILLFDQRGRGPRIGPPGDADRPPNWQRPWPALVFRPDQGQRSEGEVIHGAAWDALRDAIVDALDDATGTRRRREVYITGNAQLALAWLAGHVFNRTSLAKVSTFNPSRGGQYLTLDMNDQRFQSTLDGIDPASLTWDGSPPASGASEVSVYIGHEDYANAVKDYRSRIGDTTALALRYVRHIGGAEDVIDIARWMKTACNQGRVRVYTSLPFHAVVLLAALLKHSTQQVTLMERDRANDTYHACLMPRG